MDAVEFAKTMQKICRSHTSCVECEFVKVQGHCGITNPEADHAGMVAVAERWAKEHPEEAADATKPKQDEPCVKTIPDNLEGAIYRAIASNKTRIEKLEYDVSVVRNNLAVLDDRIYALREKVDHTPTMEPSQTPEPKRTNKDVLLAAFPRMVMDGDVPASCPRIMDRDIHIQHCAGRSCEACRHEYWLAGAEE